MNWLGGRGKTCEKKSVSFRRDADRNELYLYLLPLIGAGFFRQFYNLLNTAVVSRYLSVTAVTVIGACTACFSMQSFIATGVTNGFSMYLTRCFGDGDREKYRQSFTAAFLILGGLTLLSILLMPLGVPGVEALLNVPEELRTETTGYLRLLFLGTGVLGARNLLLRVLEGMGKSGVSGILSSVSVVSHTLILLFLILGLHRGVSAATLAVLLNDLWISAVLFLYLRKKYPELTGWKLPNCLEVWKELLLNGGTKSFMMILVGCGNFVMQRAMNSLPSEMIAGYAYADNLSNFLMVPTCALGTAAIAAAGQNMGRKDYGAMKYYHKRLIKAHWACSAAAIAITFTAGRVLILLLAGREVSEEVVRAAAMWLYICIPAFTGLGAAMIGRNYLQVMGKYKNLMALGVLEMGVTILFACFAVPVWGYPAVCLSIFTKWMALGIVSSHWCRSWLYRK